MRENIGVFTHILANNGTVEPFPLRSGRAEKFQKFASAIGRQIGNNGGSIVGRMKPPITCRSGVPKTYGNG